MTNERTELMRAIRDEIVALSTPLADARRAAGTHPVIGEGSHQARLMFVGEAPGRNEATTGRPFVGAAGKILDSLLAATGIARTDVYITNIVKDRPPMNRDPEPEEIDAYGPFLDRQIDIIRPDIVATLGRFAMGYVLAKFGLADRIRPISLLHGTILEGTAPHGSVLVVPLYHPAVAVYNGSMKEVLQRDFGVLKQFECRPRDTVE
jgi:DNA polymerase